MTAHELVIAFPKPDEVMNLNDRLHHFAKARRTKEWRHAAWAHAVNRRRHPSWPQHPLGHCKVAVSIPVRSLRIRRDPHNWMPTVKAIIDGLVTAKVFPDDSIEHVEVLDPRFHIGDDMVIVTIQPTGGT